MDRLLIPLWTFLAGLSLGVIITLQWPEQGPGGHILSVGPTERVDPPPPVPTLAPQCLRDPANLPPPPPGPDGRPANFLHGCGSGLYDSWGRSVKISGINWNGMETGDYVPGGLGNRKWQELLDLIASLGFNTVRIPFSNEALGPDRKVNNVDSTLNPTLKGKSPLDVLDILIAGARERGLKVILDRHWPSPSSQGPLWHSPTISQDRWIEDWRTLAARYIGNDTVIGVDLSNEPRGEATWGGGDPATDWRLAAERAGNAILEVNPYLLVFVEGIETYGGDHYWWGGNLLGVRYAPIELRVSNRIVYSPHDYGPNISQQPWFGDPLFPGNLPDVWDRYWGFIHQEGLAPVVLGEFGGRSVGDDREGQWQRVLLAYLRKHSLGAMVWSLNPNWDTGGIVGPDWKTVDWSKAEVYRQILGDPLDTGAGGVFGRAPTRWRLLVSQGQGPDGGGVAFAFKVVNDGPEALDLGRCEVRYWLSRGSEALPSGAPSVDAAESVGGQVAVDLVAGGGGDSRRYLRLGFGPKAGLIDRYGASDKVTVRLSWPNHSRAQDPSFFAGSPQQPDQFLEWDRVTLYVDGQLVWGQEP